MVSVMRVDVAPLKHFIMIGVAGVAIVVIAIIMGATGPNEFFSVTDYAYDCPNQSHVWDPETCGGYQLSNNQTWWWSSLPTLTSLNRFWTLQFMVYTLQTGEVERELQVEVLVYGTNNPPPKGEWMLLYTRNTTQDVVCGQGPGPCEPLVLVDERNLKYTYYSVTVRILNGYQMEGETAAFVGDVKFSIWTGNSGFSSYELALRVIFLFITCILLVAYLWFMRSTPLDDWAWEQKALALLLLGLLALNNPFFGLQFAVNGWFFHFLDALFTMTYLSIFLLFGLLVLDKVRLEDVRMTLGRRHIPKYLLVGVFALLGIILFAWVDIRDDVDPIQGHASLLSGVAVLFYIEATVYAGILIWLAVLVVMTIPVAAAKPYIMTRFLFISIPTSFSIISILIGIFNGTFGPLNESTLSMVFFLTLYNEYVWILTIGFWPVQERFTVRNPSEADSIIHFDSSL
eukprot:Phypoly_transcript_07701.p1 GENE.Phypoly_transcript_07701~~Phypoly_transcript_07701.p1  ORF type:complete len:457 (+),score=40.01 Phypoly_transcript_07701:137-1507(+)